MGVAYKSHYDTRGKTRKKLTLYFTEEEIKKLDEIANEGRGWRGKLSMATTIENIVKEKLESLKAKEKKKEKKKPKKKVRRK